MADEADYASEREEFIRNAGIKVALSKTDFIKTRLFNLQKNEVDNQCLYCEEPIIGYEKAFCACEVDDIGNIEYSCHDEYWKERTAKESGRILKVHDDE